MMNFIISGIVAVIAMTLFSAIYNTFTKDEFREPNLLTQIFKKLFQRTLHKPLYVYGWLVHFLIGFVFLGLYEFTWRWFAIERSIDIAVLFGLVSGFLGIIGWYFMFKAVRYTYHFNYAHYYFHLVLAHIVFSVVAVFVYMQ